MEQEEAIHGKENVETDNVSVSSALPPPKLNLRRLESIQRLLQYASALVLFVFIALIVVSYFKYYDTVEAIALNEKKIKQASEDLINKNADLDNKNIEIANRQSLLNTQEETIKKK